MGNLLCNYPKFKQPTHHVCLDIQSIAHKEESMYYTFYCNLISLNLGILKCMKIDILDIVFQFWFVLIYLQCNARTGARMGSLQSGLRAARALSYYWLYIQRYQYAL